jgi:hypothetical protein
LSLTIYPSIHTHEVFAKFGREFALHVIQLNDSIENIWFGAEQTHIIFNIFGCEPIGHCLHTPYLTAPV